MTDATLTPKLKRAYRWKADYLSDKVKFSISVLSALTEPVIADLVRRGEQWNDPDGYPTGSGDGSGVRGSDETTSTERAALHGLPDKAYDEYGVKIRDDWQHRQRERDVIGEALDQLFSSIVELSGHVRIIEKKHLVVAKAGEKLRGRPNQLVLCLACHRDVACTTADPIRSGNCSACDSAWRRWKDTHDMTDPVLQRSQFRAEREKFDGHLSTACELCADPIYKRIAS